MRTCACVHVRNSSRMINMCSCVRVLVFMLGTTRMINVFMRTCACVHVRNSSRMINIVHAYVCLCSC